MTTTSTTAGLSAADQAAISGLPVRMVKSWAAHDADGFADLFHEDGTLILPGMYLKGRDAIRTYMADAYATTYKGSRVTGQPIDLVPLGPDAVALITQGGVIAARENELSAKAAIRASWIAVKRDGEWRLAVYQNCQRDPDA